MSTPPRHTTGRPAGSRIVIVDDERRQRPDLEPRARAQLAKIVRRVEDTGQAERAHLGDALVWITKA